MSSRSNVRYLNPNQLVNELRKIRGATPATIIIRTTPRLNKKSRETGEDNPFFNPITRDWNIEKVSKFNVFLNFNYGNSVNRQRGREEKEEGFTPAQHRYADHFENMACILQHRDTRELYLYCKMERKLSVEYRTIIKSQPVSEAELQQYMPPRGMSRTQGTDKEILVMSPKLSNLIEIHVNRQVIVVT